jgi:L-asparaginase II
MLEAAGRELAARGEAPGVLHNNCSGKHAGFVCLACVMHGKDGDLRPFLRGYVQPDHPVMREVTAAIEAATATSLRDAPMGIDGCSIPTYAVPLRQLALAFARVGTGTHLRPGLAAAAQRLRQAIARAPFPVAGTGRFDTQVMARLGKRVCCKVGAEGVYCAALPERGLGVAIKVDDGNTARAAEVAMAAVIEACLPLEGEDAAFLAGLSTVPLHNWNGLRVSELRAHPDLRRTLR